ncbi:MAG: hypothetical protein ACOX8Q_09345 [Christensenellales bacterium]|jgi:Tfp pilus assembly protein PilX
MMRMPTTAKKTILFFNHRGSAIIMALVTMTVLIILGLGVATLSIGTLKANRADAATNTAYYAANAGVNSAIEQLKYETANYYSAMMHAQSAEYWSLYNNFFANISSSAQLHFAEPAIDGVTTVTTFATGGFDTTQNICEFLVSCTATASDGTKYAVNGVLNIKKVDVRTVQQYVWITDNAAVKSGGTLNLESKNSVTVVGGNIIVGNLSYTEKDGLPYSITGGELIIDPSVGSTINDMLTYPSYSDPVLVDGIYYSQKETINWSNLPEPPVSIVTAEGVDIKISSCTVPEGTIYIRGNANISNCTVNCDIYCDGNITISNYSSISGNIYCRGNVYLTNTDAGGNIFCDGFVDYNNGTLSASIYSGNGITVHNGITSGNMFSPAEIIIENTDVTDGIIYSSAKLTLGSGNMTAVFFSGSSVEFMGDATVNGTVVAKNDIYFKVDATKDLFVDYYYSEETINNIVYDPKNSFFFTLPSGAKLDEDVILDQAVTAVGRIN